MTRAYYSDYVNNFISTSESKILGELVRNHSLNLDELQRNAWINQIRILKTAFKDFIEAKIYFEFSIPRMGRRVDNILIYHDLIFVIEFKIGAKRYDNSAIAQVVDYALDLKNFHSGSHGKKILPVLVSTEAENCENILDHYEDFIYKPLLANKFNLTQLVESCKTEIGKEYINFNEWENSDYKPTPTIIEAARALYLGHSVKEISRSDSGAINLSHTTSCLNDIIEESKKNNKKSICFITGVPGAGKTLAGLNIATERMRIDENEHAVFLSGNGPLVKVLREALTRDEVNKHSDGNNKITKKVAAKKTHAFIQNIHHFRDDLVFSNSAPIEKVLVFDEAQRAWSKEQTTSFMSRKKGIVDFNMSEPEFLIDVMNRHIGWCVIICLVGGGQEINTGESGLEEWMISLKEKYSHWNIYYSQKIIRDNNYLNNNVLIDWMKDRGMQKEDLHLSVSIRSFRSEALSLFIENLLNIDLTSAQSVFHKLKHNYPIRLTRDIITAKRWLKEKARGSERYGIISSSGAYRLRPFGINVKNKIDPSIWFLNDNNDVRSSYFMEDVATEFDIQGLELDWTCLAWGGDFYFDNGTWHYQKFKGTKWQKVQNVKMKKYLLNAYRVLLTRARQGMIIFVPEGDDEDDTRLNKFYEGTYQYLRSIGISEI